MRNVVISEKSITIVGGVVGGWVSVMVIVDVGVVGGTVVVIVCGL